jgi:choline dehydrogenase
MPETNYDYVILGAGSAGSVLAARLSEDGARRVLLVEAGGRADSLFVRMPAGNGFLFGNPVFDWGYHSEPQDALDGRRIYYPRGKGLGGTSLLNGMIYTRGNRRDYDGWRDGGLAGWGYGDLLPYFKRAEANARGAGPYHGGAGPLRVVPSPNFHAIDRTFLEACREAGHGANDDMAGRRQLGAGRLDVTIDGGRRASTAWAYLKPAMTRPNLDVRTGTRALRIVIERGRATGVELAEGGTRWIAHAEGEVVLCLGAFASPHLLLLSGIGDGEEIRRHGLRPVVDLPGVGRNLQDHVNIPVQFTCLDPRLSFARWQRFDRALWLGLRYVLTRGGPGAGPFWSTCLFSALDQGGELPDFQTFFTPMVVVEDLFAQANRAGRARLLDLEKLGARYLSRGKRALAGFQLDVNPMMPESRGSLRLGSADPSAPPRIDPHMLAAESEQRLAVAAVRLARDLAAQPAFKGIVGVELSPGSAAGDDASIRAAVRKIANTAHHPVGTCRMGPAGAPGTVVDGALRVQGVDGLRVVDASVIPRQIRGNPNSTVLAIAEKASDLILGRPAAAAEDPS